MTQLEELDGMYDDITEEKWRPAFDSQATFVGNGIYQIAGLHSQDTRELFLMFVHQQETVEQQAAQGWADTILRSRKKIHYYRGGRSLCDKDIVTRHHRHFSLGVGSEFVGHCKVCVKKQKEIATWEQ